MAFFLKLLVLMVWTFIMTALIIASTQGRSGLRRRAYTSKGKSAGDKDGERYFTCQLVWTGRWGVVFPAKL